MRGDDLLDDRKAQSRSAFVLGAGAVLREVEAFLLQRDRGDLAARQIEQIVGQLAHPRALFDNHVDQFCLFGVGADEFAALDFEPTH
ncbi:MAG: hypothetical protein Q7S58_08560 [Candidatus Binatus sp.]|uniref:hypothetical protein n=1 Tax=Candidatus Binatus sp. TaxID=2811406 RepID=UPI00271F8BD3|nr:hypothetical protein [Candidatus Binatus sp.]MDO8432444.1 hypothetical protein [Candidatus Binatus sp.]